MNSEKIEEIKVAVLFVVVALVFTIPVFHFILWLAPCSASQMICEQVYAEATNLLYVISFVSTSTLTFSKA